MMVGGVGAFTGSVADCILPRSANFAKPNICALANPSPFKGRWENGMEWETVTNQRTEFSR